MAFPTTVEENSQDKAQTVRLLGQIAVTLSHISQVRDPDPELDAQEAELRGLEAELQELLRGDHPSRGRMVDVVQRASQITHAATASLAAHIGGASARQEQTQAMIVRAQDRERASRDIYDSFQRNRSTPADPEIETDVKKAQAAYEQALKSGDSLAISSANLDLIEARARDTAYALGRGDPAAKQAHEEQLKHLDRQLSDHARILTDRGLEPKQVAQDIAERNARIKQRTREAGEKGARDAGRSLSATDLQVLGKAQKSEPPSQFAAFESQIEAAKPDTPVPPRTKPGWRACLRRRYGTTIPRYAGSSSTEIIAFASWLRSVVAVANPPDVTLCGNQSTFFQPQNYHFSRYSFCVIIFHRQLSFFIQAAFEPSSTGKETI